VIAIHAKATGLPPVLAKPAGSGARAWICEGTSCLAPIDRLEDLIEQVFKAEEIQ